MDEQKKSIFIAAEDALKKGIKKFMEEGEDEVVAATLAHIALERMFEKQGMIYPFYKEVLADLEEIYVLEPGKTYKVYQKYGVYNKK